MDTVHALWGYVLVKEVWWEGLSFRAFISERFSNFTDLCVGILNLPNSFEVDLFVMVA